MTSVDATPVHEAEVWCSRCDRPSSMTVLGSAYCDEHGRIELWKQNSPAWRASYSTPAAEPTELELRAMDGDR
jgi:hypothetical protein